MAKLEKQSVSQAANRLTEPFSMINLARVGDILVSVYICQGMLDWHKHPHNDELFWAYEGTLVLESELGQVILNPGDVAVMPKGIEHRSGSGARVSMLLLRCDLTPGRKNGRRRLYVLDGELGLRRVSLLDAVQALDMPLHFETVAAVEESAVQVAQGEGTWPVDVPVTHDLLLYVLKGTATVRTSESMVHLHPGEFTVVPQDAAYQLSTTRGTALVRVTQELVG
jgi:mannose-6-phosphate isomerase-like protein (cupin superfamily)